MSTVKRRELFGLFGAGITALAAAPGAPAGQEALGAPRAVDLTGDGIPLSPAEYAALLGALARGGGVATDEYSRGGAVAALEEQFARLLGKEDAVFMPSGTLANHIAVRALCGDRRRVIVQEISHLYNDSGDCAQELSALNLIPLAPGQATFAWEDVSRVLERTASGRVARSVGAISIESPVRRLHHQVFDWAEMQGVCAEARRRGIGLHLDGARLFVAAAYSGRSPAEYAALFDTVYVSLWKCFNAAGGAILAGPRALLEDLYHVRRMFGGALWEAWPYAAVARHYADGYLERLTAAVRVSEAFIGLLSNDARFAIERVPNGTSAFHMRPRSGDPAAFRERLRARGIMLPAADGDGFWLRVNETFLAAPSAEALADAFQSALG
jgi:threonine aldolase